MLTVLPSGRKDSPKCTVEACNILYAYNVTVYRVNWNNNYSYHLGPNSKGSREDGPKCSYNLTALLTVGYSATSPVVPGSSGVARILSHGRHSTDLKCINFQNSKKYKEWRRQDFISREDFPIVACRVAWYVVAVASPGFYLTGGTARAVSASISKTQSTKSPFAV